MLDVDVERADQSQSDEGGHVLDEEHDAEAEQRAAQRQPVVVVAEGGPEAGRVAVGRVEARVVQQRVAGQEEVRDQRRDRVQLACNASGVALDWGESIGEGE